MLQKGHLRVGREGKKDAQSQLNRLCNFIVYNLYDVAIEARKFFLMSRNNVNNVLASCYRQIRQGPRNHRVLHGWLYPGPDEKHAKKLFYVMEME